MKLVEQLLHEINNPALAHEGQAQLRCQLAKELEESGDYEAARDAMGELWRRVGERPQLAGLGPQTAAEVLLRAGSLTGWIGSAKKIEGAQETAKNLLSESISIFAATQNTEKLAEAQTELAYCYWRVGSYDEARIILQEALRRLGNSESEQKIVALLRSAIVERSATRCHDSLRILTELAPLVEAGGNNALKGKFHNQLAVVLKNLGAAEHRQDYIDRALVEFAAADFYFEQAGHTRYQGYVKNNLGMLFLAAGKFREAHEHIDQARSLFGGLKDLVPVAQVDETRAQALLAEGRVAEAEAVVRAAVEILVEGDEQSLLAQALTTHGIALARLGRRPQAHVTFMRAIEGAALAGSRECAGQAVLAALEELGDYLAPDELCALYDRAADLLIQSQQPDLHARLNIWARRAAQLLNAGGHDDTPMPVPAAQSKEADASSADWQGFCLKDEVLRHERQLIERALKDAGGVVTRAAQLLGFRHHQTFIALLNNRHRSLLPARNPAVPRKRSIIRIRETRRVARHRIPLQTRPVTILYVEDDGMVRATLKEVLELEGWQIEDCEDGTTALQKLEGHTRYDLLLFDHSLPGVTGLELVRRARNFPRHRATPIVMLSADDLNGEAHRAGVDAFLHKPQDLPSVVDTITRLLAAPERA